jgi:hypothetical protein
MQLTCEYDGAGDTLYISKVPPCPEQETEPLEYDVTARRNPQSGAIENRGVMFFTCWLLKAGGPPAKDLRELFAEPHAATGT